MAQTKRPFLYCGAVYGLMGGFFGLGSLFVALVWFLNTSIFLDRVFSNMKFLMSPQYLSPQRSFGLLLGWLGAFLCVRQQLKKLEILKHQ